MDRRSTELAQQGLRIVSETLGPHYDLLRQELAGQLGYSATHLENLQEQVRQGEHNYKLLNSFLRHFPVAKPYTSDIHVAFTPANAYEALQVESHVLWLRGPYILSPGVPVADPYFMIGRRKIRTEETREYTGKTELLLAYAAKSNNRAKTGELRFATVWDSELAICDALKDKLQFTYTDDKLSRIFDPTIKSLVIKNGDGPYKTRETNSQTLPKPSLFERKPEATVADKGIRVYLGKHPDPKIKNNLPNSILADYDVLTHLHLMATAFHKERDWSSLMNYFSEGK